MDVALGAPFNIASYSLLTMMIAQVCGYLPGEFIHTVGDAHLYANTIDPMRQMLLRDEDPDQPKPRVELNTAVTDIFAFKASDIILHDYHPHPAIKMDVAV